MLIYLQMIDDPADRDRFETAYRTYRGFMYHAALSILQNELDAEDAVHEAFIAVAKNMDKLKDLHVPATKSYLLTIAERKAIDIYRKKAAHPTAELNENLNGLSYQPPEDDTLARCILRLPARYREVILLRYEQGLSTREVAGTLGLSLSAASKLEQRAKHRLDEFCREEGLL